MNDEALLLASAQMKVVRAINQLKDLGDDLRSFNESKPYRIIFEDDLVTGERVMVYNPDPIPWNWAVRIGEILYDLRSALDHAIYELSVIYSGEVVEKTEFPIFDNEARFFERKRNGDPANKSGLYRIRGLSQDTQRVIEAMQPFSVRKDGKETFLSVLHEMCNTDKHRTPHLIFRNANETWLRSMENIRIERLIMFDRNLNERTELARYRVHPDDREMQMDTEITINILFDQGSCSLFGGRPQPVGAVLSQIIEGVRSVLNDLHISVVSLLHKTG